MTGQSKLGLVQLDRSMVKMENFPDFYFWTQHFFGGKFFLGKKLFGPNIFLEVNFFGPKIFLPQNLFGPKMHLKLEFDSGAGPSCSCLY